MSYMRSSHLFYGEILLPISLVIVMTKDLSMETGYLVSVECTGEENEPIC